MKSRLYTIHVEKDNQIHTYTTINTYSAFDAVDSVFNRVSRMYGTGNVWANVSGMRKNNSTRSF